MYERHFGLRHAPFSIAPDPRYLFMSERHREALAHLLYGLRSGGGFVLLTGEIGAGKTTVCRCFLEQVPAHCRVAYIFNPKLNVGELLQTVCDEFKIAVNHPGLKAQVDALNTFLLGAHAAGQICVLVIDEAQSLASEVLEQLRLLTNLETQERKLLQIVLIGQPELREMLARPELEQLAQRVIARFHLGALSEGETRRYVAHRLAVAGLAGPLPFSQRALRRIHALSGGVPRRINLLCDRALLGAYAGNSRAVGSDIVAKAATEAFGESPLWRRARWVLPGLGLTFILIAIVAALAAWPVRAPRQLAASAAASAPAVAASAPASSVTSTPASAQAQASARAAAPAAPAIAQRMSEPPRGRIEWPVQALPERDAWRALAALWGSPQTVCDKNRGQPLECFRAQDFTLALIRQLDRPGLVTLNDGKGGRVPALLTALERDHVTLHLGGQPQRVTLAAFGAAWRGDFGTFWRAPGQALPQWLAASAASSPAENSARLRAFQRGQGLPADGVAGALTQMQINRALGIGEPRLADSR